MKTRTASLMLLAALLFAGSLSAADWPTFRGADRTDISAETGLLKQWPADGPKKIWTSDQGGLGYAGFSIVKGTLYTMGAREGKELLIALDAATGKEKWNAPLGDVLANNWGDGPRGTPTVDDDRVYTISGQGDIVCAKCENGEVVWKAKMSDFGGKIPGWGYAESALVDGDNLVCTPGGPKGTMLALDKMSGKKIWQSEDWTDLAQYASVIVAEHGGARQYIQLTMKHVGGVDAKTGKTIWLSEWGGRTAVIPTPIFHEGKVYITSGYGVGCKQIDLGTSNSPVDEWSNQNMVNHHGGVILVGGHLYGYSDKGGWTCQDWKTGEVKWTDKEHLGKGAIHCADGMLYLLQEASGLVVLIEASAEGWKEHGRFKLEPQTLQRKPQGKIWTHPVVSNGRLYLRDQEFISCYDVKG